MVVDAQSAIVGKWTKVSAKQFFTPEGAKQAGKPVIEKQTSPNDKLELEFKSDHTYIWIAGYIKFHTSTDTMVRYGKSINNGRHCRKKIRDGRQDLQFFNDK